MPAADVHDYVIVGAGTAGCVVARRLLERSDATVLLLEAGGSADRPAVHATDIASMISLWTSPETSWGYRTVPQEGCGGREIPIAQGKMVGGGSSVNAMLWVRGNRRDFDHWNHLGNEGWSYADLLPYFKRAENYRGGDPLYRGHSGPLHVTDLLSPSEISTAFVHATKEAGFTADGSDYNGAQQRNAGFLYQSLRTPRNERSSAAAAYLGPVLGDPRLTLRTHAHATRLVIRDGRAAAVEYLRDGQAEQATATAEIIVSCGAFASPRLLMLSGIGPADELRSLGISPVVSLTGVGRNLQDHLLFGVGWACSAPQSPPQLLAEAGLFAHSRTGLEHASPDLQFFVGPIQYFDDSYKTDGPGFTFAPILVQPRSRGVVKLRSADPLELAVVDPGYLRADADVDALVAGIEIARQVAHANSFTGLRGRELAPGAEVTDRAGLVRYVRQSASTVWHPVGTCRMGHDPDSVVDPLLRVHGVAGLRVVDASVMPTITAGNTEAPVVAIAEKAADLLLPEGHDHDRDL
jgi:choline dehydrogenase